MTATGSYLNKKKNKHTLCAQREAPYLMLVPDCLVPCHLSGMWVKRQDMRRVLSKIKVLWRIWDLYGVHGT